jgi:hypothetical protein
LVTAISGLSLSGLISEIDIWRVFRARISHERHWLDALPPPGCLVSFADSPLERAVESRFG